MSDALEIAKEAIGYTLSRFQTDPEFAYHMWHTETFERLLKAYAALSDENEKALRKKIEAQAKKLPTSRCAEWRDIANYCASNHDQEAI